MEFTDSRAVQKEGDRIPKGAENYPVIVYWSVDAGVYHATAPDWDAHDLGAASGNTPAEALQRIYECVDEKLNAQDQDARQAPGPNLRVINEQYYYDTLAELPYYERSDNDKVRGNIGEVASDVLRDFHDSYTPFGMDELLDKGAHQYPVTVYWSTDSEGHEAIAPSWYGYNLELAKGSTPAEALQYMFDVINDRLNIMRERGEREVPRPVPPIIYEEDFYFALDGLAQYESSDDIELSELGALALSTIKGSHAHSDEEEAR